MARRKTVIGTLFAKNPLMTVVLVGGVGFLAFLGLRKIFRPMAPAPRIIAGKATGLPPGWSPYVLATQLYNEMQGLGWGTYPSSWDTLAKLPTDDMVIAVYKAFNQQYFNLGKGTLTKWIQDEWQLVGTSKQRVLTRLSSLQLP